jgi:hypothetical protein
MVHLVTELIGRLITALTVLYVDYCELNRAQGLLRQRPDDLIRRQLDDAHQMLGLGLADQLANSCQSEFQAGTQISIGNFSIMDHFVGFSETHSNGLLVFRACSLKQRLLQMQHESLLVRSVETFSLRRYNLSL